MATQSEKKLIIIGEGKTEYKVLKPFLAPYCTNFAKIEMLGRPDEPRGSGRILTNISDIVKLALLDESAVVFCLIDLHNAPFEYPKSVWHDPDTIQSRFDYIQNYFYIRIDKTLHDRFFPWVVVYEIETWLLADIEALRSYFGTKQIQPYPTPESIENPTDEIHKLMERYRDKGYKKNKAEYAKSLFDKASAERVYDDNCPYFVGLIDALQTVQGIPIVVSQPIAYHRYPPKLIELLKKLQQVEQEINDLWNEIEKNSELSELGTYEPELKELEAEAKRLHNLISDFYKSDENP